MADHQVAHVYVNDSGDAAFLAEVRAVIEQADGVGGVFDREAQAAQGLLHSRSGDLLAVAKAGAWFCYYYWEDDRRAPDFARTVDIHRKPGYDPAELFIDPAIRFPAGRVAKFLLKKKLGLRALLEVIPLDAMLVRGSHGRMPEDENDHPVLIAGGAAPAGNIGAQEVFGKLLKAVTGTAV